MKINAIEPKRRLWIDPRLIVDWSWIEQKFVKLLQGLLLSFDLRAANSKTVKKRTELMAEQNKRRNLSHKFRKVAKLSKWLTKIKLAGVNYFATIFLNIGLQELSMLRLMTLLCTVWRLLCYNHYLKTTVWWPLCDDHCVTTTVWQDYLALNYRNMTFWTKWQWISHNWRQW